MQMVISLLYLSLNFIRFKFRKCANEHIKVSHWNWLIWRNTKWRRRKEQREKWMLLLLNTPMEYQTNLDRRAPAKYVNASVWNLNPDQRMQFNFIFRISNGNWIVYYWFCSLIYALKKNQYTRIQQEREKKLKNAFYYIRHCISNVLNDFEIRQNLFHE